MGDLDDLRERIDAFVEARGWRQYHTPKNLAMALTGEVGELVEILQWLTPEESSAAGADRDLRAALEDEIADVLIYLAAWRAASTSTWSTSRSPRSRGTRSGSRSTPPARP